MSDLSLSKIAFLTDGALSYALDNFELNMSKEELMQYLNEYYKENKVAFVPTRKTIKGEKKDVVEFEIKLKNGKELLAIFEKNTNKRRPPKQIWDTCKIRG